MEALRLGRLDDDERRPFRAARGIGLGDDDDQIGELAVADEGLLPVDDIVIAVQPGRRLDPLQVRSRARLGHRDGADEFAGRHLRQPFPLLLFGAVVEDVGRDDRAVQRGEKAADLLPGHLLHQDDFVTKVAAGAAVSLRNGETQQAGFAGFAPRRALDDSSLAPSLDAGGRRVFVEKLRHRILEDDDVFFLEEVGSIDIQHWHCFPPGREHAARAVGRSDR